MIIVSHFYIILPFGISFYTFETISYTVDVYRGILKPEKFIDYLLFVTFFPKLVAGPIQRANELIPQFKNGNHLIYSQSHMESKEFYMAYF